MTFMAQRAHVQKVQVVPGASHVVMISHPHEVAGLTEQAATAAKSKPGIQHRPDRQNGRGVAAAAPLLRILCRWRDTRLLRG